MNNISIIKTPLKGHIKFTYTTHNFSDISMTINIISYYNVNLKLINTCGFIYVFKSLNIKAIFSLQTQTSVQEWQKL